MINSQKIIPHLNTYRRSINIVTPGVIVKGISCDGSTVNAVVAPVVRSNVLSEAHKQVSEHSKHEKATMT